VNNTGVQVTTDIAGFVQKALSLASKFRILFLQTAIVDGKGKAPQLLISRINHNRKVNEPGFRPPEDSAAEKLQHQARKLEEYELLLAETQAAKDNLLDELQKSQNKKSDWNLWMIQ